MNRLKIRQTPERLSLVAILFVVLGGIALFVGYLGVSDTLESGEQLPYVVSGGMGGLFLLGLGAVVRISSDIAEVRRDILDLREMLEARNTDGTAITSPSPKESADSGAPPANGVQAGRRRGARVT